LRTPRTLLLILGCAALALAAVQGLTGMQELVFYAGPFLLLIGTLQPNTATAGAYTRLDAGDDDKRRRRQRPRGRRADRRRARPARRRRRPDRRAPV
jgi:hypothetical protein